jgi:hypothetical protein
MKPLAWTTIAIVLAFAATLNLQHPQCEQARDHVGQTISGSLDYYVTMIEWVTFNPHDLSVPEFFEFHGKPQPH